jgi:polysaccharide biosynthesis transport protein
VLFGLLLGGATAIGRDIMDDSFHTTEELEDGLGLPIVGIIPLSADASDVVGILNDRRSFVSEAYRSLRTALRRECGKERP